MRQYRIAVVPGDGIGKEVVPEGLRLLAAVEGKLGAFRCEPTHFPWGSDYYREHGEMMPEDGNEALKPFSAILFGAVGDPEIPDHVTLWGLRLKICQGFDQYANVRPTRILPGIDALPLKEYVVYLPEGGEVTVNLSVASGAFAVEWIDAAAGTGLAAEPVWVKTYRLVKAANGRQDHLYTTEIAEKEAAEAAGYMTDGEDFMVSSVPFVGSNEVVRLRKNGPGYVIRLYTTSPEEREELQRLEAAFARLTEPQREVPEDERHIDLRVVGDAAARLLARLDAVDPLVFVAGRRRNLSRRSGNPRRCSTGRRRRASRSVSFSTLPSASINSPI